jgi:hypothetical protein
MEGRPSPGPAVLLVAVEQVVAQHDPLGEISLAGCCVGGVALHPPGPQDGGDSLTAEVGHVGGRVVWVGGRVVDVAAFLEGGGGCDLPAAGLDLLLHQLGQTNAVGVVLVGGVEQPELAGPVLHVPAGARSGQHGRLAHDLLAHVRGEGLRLDLHGRVVAPDELGELAEERLALAGKGAEVEHSAAGHGLHVVDLVSAVGHVGHHREGLHLGVVVGRVSPAGLGAARSAVEIDVEVDEAAVGLEPVVEIALPGPQSLYHQDSSSSGGSSRSKYSDTGLRSPRAELV